MKRKIVILLSIHCFCFSLFSQTVYQNSAPNSDTWYKINTRGKFLCQISTSGNYAVHQQLVYLVSGHWNTAEVTVISEFNYNHKYVDLQWGYIGDGTDRYLAVKSTAITGGINVNGISIYDVSDAGTAIELEEYTGAVTEIEEQSNLFVNEKDRKVGIGTSDPREKLDIKGNLKWGTSGTTTWGVGLLTMESGWNSNNYPTLSSHGGSNGGLIMLHNPHLPYRTDNKASGYAGKAGIRMASDESVSSWWDMGLGGDFFYVYRKNSGEFMRINSNGSVGIGTATTGTHKLAVEGSIGAREVKVEAGGWSDFVFEDDYELRTLKQVEKHINEEGHLPEIPNANEVAENGINLGEMDAKLLQKIEELTLYLIEQNKKIEQLQKKVHALEKD